MTNDDATKSTTTMIQSSSEATHFEMMPPDRYNLLVEFAVRHVDFQFAELQSVLDTYGITVLPPSSLTATTTATTTTTATINATINATASADVCRMIRLPNEGREETSDPKRPCVRPFCILSFDPRARGPRFHGCVDDDVLDQIATKTEKNPSDQEEIGRIRSRNNRNNSSCCDIATILARCTLVRSVVELWGVGTSLETCAEATHSWVTKIPLGRSILAKQTGARQSWKTTIHTLGTKYTRDEQDSMRKLFHELLTFEGPVQMNNPDHEFLIIREAELDRMGSPLFPRVGMDKQPIAENDTRPPLGVYFGRILGGRLLKGRGGLDKYNLKKRSYLGPTSMDAELSFIMANLAQVESGSMVLDPFVGTGSILLSCALRGASYCVGTDIDIRVLRGRSSHENVYSNFAQYKLPRPELIRSDNALYSRHFRCQRTNHRHRDNENDNNNGNGNENVATTATATATPLALYDAIVTDPPYGIRAGARRTGSKLDDPRPVREEHRHDHIAQTKPYAVSDVMADLVDVAARTLRQGGRLVYVIPSFSSPEFDAEADLPRHPLLDIVHLCYQPLTMDLGRRIVTMERKEEEYDEAQYDRYMSSVWKNGAESAQKCANIREKILEAARKKPDYEEKSAIRKQKRKAHREAKKVAKQLKKKEGMTNTTVAQDDEEEQQDENGSKNEKEDKKKFATTNNDDEK